MRITGSRKLQIKKVVANTFGDASEVWLFGYRVDDNKRGGDLDLYVEPISNDWFDAKIQAIQQLESILSYPVDIVVKEQDKNIAIYKVAKTQGLKL